jgi:hypothetical protein
MLMLLSICLLIGAALGQRFKVIVMTPAMALAAMAAVGFTHAGTFWQILAAVFVVTTTLQIGYLGGVGIRYLTATTRNSQVHANSVIAHLTSGRRQ